MKRSLLVVIFPFLLMVGCWAQGPSSDVLKHAHASTYNIVQKTILGPGSKCSATAVGPHALLTASHCEEPSDFVSISGKPAHIFNRTRDGMDHTIYSVDFTFPVYARIKLGAPLEQGEHVFVFGNPGSFIDLLRHGYVSGFSGTSEDDLIVDDDSGLKQVLFDLNGFHGDSGSAVFDAAGNVVDVISTINGGTHDSKSTWDAFKLMGGFRLAFNQDEIDHAVAFVPPPFKVMQALPSLLPFIKFDLPRMK